MVETGEIHSDGINPPMTTPSSVHSPLPNRAVKKDFPFQGYVLGIRVPSAEGMEIIRWKTMQAMTWMGGKPVGQ